MKLQLSTWQDVAGWLEDHDAILIPIGSTEQHGPIGLVGTDALCPEIIAETLHDEDGILVAPTLSIGMAQHHLAFPGSISLRPSTLIAVVGDVVRSLASQGFRKFFFLNGHGGNIATVQAAFAELWADASLRGQASGLDFRLFNWFMGPRVQRLSAELYGDDEGSHATPSEISLTWHGYPEARRSIELDPERAPSGEIRDAADYRKTFPDGRIGAASGRADPEHGRRLHRAAVDDARQAWREFTARSGPPSG